MFSDQEVTEGTFLIKMASNVVGRDVIRGQCLVDNCDCEEFDLDESLSFVVTAMMHL